MIKKNHRNLQFIDFKSIDAEEILVAKNIQNVCISFTDLSKFVDIGALCYSSRSKRNKSTSSEEYFLCNIKPETFRSARIGLIEGLLQHLYFLFSVNLTSKTIRHRLNKITVFIEWCDNKPELSLSENELIGAYIAYTNFLYDEWQSGSRSEGNACDYQYPVREFILEYLGEEGTKSLREIYQFTKNNSLIVNTEPPRLEDADRALEFYGKFFYRICQFLTNFEKFPFVLDLPSDKFSCFPSRNVTFGSMNKEWDRARYRKRNAPPFHFHELRLLTDLELIERNRIAGHDTKPRYRYEHLRHANNVLIRSNENMYDSTRLFIATHAVRAFAYVFIAISGINSQVASEIELENDTRDVGGQSLFKGLKLRARQRPVVFKTDKKFKNLFKQYLKLRNYISNAMDEDIPDRLFVTITQNKYRTLDPKFFRKLQNYFEDHFELDVSVTIKQSRAFRTIFSLDNLDVENTAEVAQNSPSVIKRNYMWGNKSTTTKQLTSLFDEYSEGFLSNQSKSYEPLPTGLCKEFRSPIKITDDDIFTPDCEQIEGCFNCEHFGVSGSEEDLVKLLSYKFVLLATKSLSSTSANFERNFRNIIASIDETVASIAKADKCGKEKVKRIKQRVFGQELLYPFWQKKLEILVDLGAI